MFYEPDKRDARVLPHDPFKAIVAPRPIGWITSINLKGEVNCAPYSYFNGINSRPNLVMFAARGKRIRSASSRKPANSSATSPPGICARR